MTPARELNALVGLLLKPGVFVLGLLALLAVRRFPEGRGRRLLGLALTAFLAGEALCGVDVYVRRAMSLAFEGGHDLLMALSYGLFVLGLYERSRETGPCLSARCARRRTCGLAPRECPRATAWGALAGWGILGAAAAGIIPILARPGVLKTALPAGIGAWAFGAYLYDRTAILSAFQQKVLPAAAVAALAAGAWSYLRKGRLTDGGAPLAFMGAGGLLFAYNRLVVVHAFGNEAALTGFVEELLEALFMAFVLAGSRAYGHRGRGHIDGQEIRDRQARLGARPLDP